MVREFARVADARFGKRVLVLDLARQMAFGIGDTQVDRATLPPGLFSAPGADVNDAIRSWARLRESYDRVLIDSPSATVSPQGLMVSKEVDGVVLVMAAEATRWPVVEHVKQNLERSGGRVLGLVLNKRQYHIPAWVYRRL